MLDKYSKISNPIDEEKSLDNLIAFFKGFNKFFENDLVEQVIQQEFKREYALLPLLVKASIYYEKQ